MAALRTASNAKSRSEAYRRLEGEGTRAKDCKEARRSLRRLDREREGGESLFLEGGAILGEDYKRDINGETSTSALVDFINDL